MIRRTVITAEAIETLKRRISLAEAERDALQLAGQEENYLRAYSMVEALELQLEDRLRTASAGTPAGGMTNGPRYPAST